MGNSSLLVLVRRAQTPGRKLAAPPAHRLRVF
jgi:hypothetical protein